jgi:hypothetical protein
MGEKQTSGSLVVIQECDDCKCFVSINILYFADSSMWFPGFVCFGVTLILKSCSKSFNFVTKYLYQLLYWFLYFGDCLFVVDSIFNSALYILAYTYSTPILCVIWSLTNIFQKHWKCYGLLLYCPHNSPYHLQYERYSSLSIPSVSWD